VLWALAVLLIAALAIYLVQMFDTAAIRSRLAAGSQIVQTQHGQIEYATRGEGPAVLVLHGAGGGYDQGLSIAGLFGGDGFRWIVPSRFGYLRTPLPADASTPAQADALADLLDSLHVDRVAILAMSGGVPPALQFAMRYPSRTTALALLSSAPFTPLTAGDQKLPVPIWVYQALFGTDFPYWLLKRIAPSRLEPVFDVKPGLRAKLTPAEVAFVDTMMDEFEPVTDRTAGIGNEGAAINPETAYPLDQIAAPTLVVHSRDDGINPFPIGEYTALHIPGAEFMPLPGGGHLLLGNEDEVRARVNAFLRRHMPAGT
jgi:pimeloyl-ACP methyl ester carboxylesterase